MTTIRTLASGSSGNAAILSRGETHLLIDMGISCRRVCQSLSALGLTPESLSGVLITHEHGDHMAGWRRISRNTERLSTVRPPYPGSCATGWRVLSRYCGLWSWASPSCSARWRR